MFVVDVCYKYLFAHPSRVIMKFQFHHYFQKRMTIGNILSGFCSTGLYPFNPNMILDNLPKPKGTEQTCITESNVEFAADVIKKFEIRHLHLCAVVANTSTG